MLETYGARYRSELTESIIPFWLKHSLDREQGGYWSCLERDGTVYDDRKYVWMQGREIWMFSKLYNAFERRQEYLDAATLGVAYMRRFGRDPQGRAYFSLTREGQPVFYQRKAYAAVFYALGLLEYSKATGDERCFRETEELYWRIQEWIAQPTLMGRPSLSGGRPMSILADIMVTASLSIELYEARPDPRYLEVMRRCIARLQPHYDPVRRVFRENLPLDETRAVAWPEERLVCPGHSLEVAWFWLHMLRYLPNDQQQSLALGVIEGALEYGWDREFGGLYYFVDVEGKPPLQLEASMKLWWPHTEALYALVLAYSLTRDDRFITWLERVDAYCHAHFADPAYGEWFGYCDRRGYPTHTCKGGPYKGFFHVPRALLYCVLRIEQR